MMGNEGKQHPLHQIAESATHKLLLKQWLKEEELIARRVTLREARLHSLRTDIAALCCFFFVFHAFFLLILFAASASPSDPAAPSAACRRSWIPCVLSLACSLAMAWAVRYKAEDERRAEQMLQREEEDGRLLGRCVEELKRKGVEFDLLKEVDALRRAKSLRVEAAASAGGGEKGRRRWSKRDSTAMFFLAASAAVLFLTRVVLCR